MADTLNDTDAGNFGNDTAAKEGAAGYVANFNGDEFNGTTYKIGETIKDDVDPATLAYLTQIGRITPVADLNDAPAGGEGGTGVPDGKSTNGSENVELSDAEQAEADQLVADNSAEQLRDMIPDGQPTSGTKADLAARIVAGRR